MRNQTAKVIFIGADLFLDAVTFQATCFGRNGDLAASSDRWTVETTCFPLQWATRNYTCQKTDWERPARSGEGSTAWAWLVGRGSSRYELIATWRLLHHVPADKPGSCGLTKASAGRWKGARVAVNLLSHDLGDIRIGATIAREVVIGAALSHPNIVSPRYCPSFVQRLKSTTSIIRMLCLDSVLQLWLRCRRLSSMLVYYKCR